MEGRTVEWTCRVSVLDQSYPTTLAPTTQIVRDINDQQGKEIAAHQATERELRAQVAGLRAQVEQLSASTAVAAREAEVRRAEAETARAEADAARGEQRELERRLVQMREEEAVRLNDANREAEQLVRGVFWGPLYRCSAGHAVGRVARLQSL